MSRRVMHIEELFVGSKVALCIGVRM
jgi:hypothetical protein